MLRRLRADLHVHTCLSPCADLQMSPQKIAERARKHGLAILAICDHNSAENAAAVIKSAESMGIVVLPGMEICTSEEVHLLAIFDNVKAAKEMQSLVYRHLAGVNAPKIFGTQVIANELDEILGFEEKLLSGATDLAIELAVNEVHKCGGVAIASHVDRESYSIVSQLGFIPDNVSFDALEITKHISTEDARKRFYGLRQWPLIRNSDAHFLDDIGSNASEYLVETAELSEIKRALREEDGRRICEAW